MFTAAVAFTAIDNITAPMRSIESQVKRVTGSFMSLNSVTGMLGGFGVAAVMYDAANAVVQYDKSLASLKAITGLTGAAFVPFKDEIERIGKATNEAFPFVAKSMELIGSLKPDLLNDAKAMGQLTEASMHLSRATGTDLPTSANNLVGILNAFQKPASMAAEYMDTLSTSEQKGTATVAELSDALKSSAALANTLGFSLDETTAYLQGFAKANIKGLDAGFKFKQVVSKLGGALTDFNPAAVGASAALNNIEKSMSKLGKTQKQKFAEELVGADNAPWLLALVSQNEAVQSLIGKQYIQGNALKQEQEREKAVATIFERMRGKFQNLIISFDSGVGVLSVVGSVMKFITRNMGAMLSVIGALAAAWVAYRTVLLVTKAVKFALVVVDAIRLLQMKGEFIWAQRNIAASLLAVAAHWAIIGAKKAHIAVTKLWIGVTWAAETAMWALSTAFYACPLVWIIALVLAFAAAVAYLALNVNGWGKAWEGMTDSMVAQFELVALAFDMQVTEMEVRWLSLVYTMQKAWASALGFIGLNNKAEVKAQIDTGNELLKAYSDMNDLVNRAAPIQQRIDQRWWDNLKWKDDGSQVFGQAVNRDAAVTQTNSVNNTTNNGILTLNINDPNNRTSVDSSMQVSPIRVRYTK